MLMVADLIPGWNVTGLGPADVMNESWTERHEYLTSIHAVSN